MQAWRLARGSSSTPRWCRFIKRNEPVHPRIISHVRGVCFFQMSSLRHALFPVTGSPKLHVAALGWKLDCFSASTLNLYFKKIFFILYSTVLFYSTIFYNYSYFLYYKSIIYIHYNSYFIIFPTTTFFLLRSHINYYYFLSFLFSLLLPIGPEVGRSEEVVAEASRVVAPGVRRLGVERRGRGATARCRRRRRASVRSGAWRQRASASSGARRLQGSRRRAVAASSPAEADDRSGVGGVRARWARGTSGEGWVQLGSGTAGGGRWLQKVHGRHTNEAEHHPKRYEKIR
jgi:hypothetical protein